MSGARLGKSPDVSRRWVFPGNQSDIIQVVPDLPLHESEHGAPAPPPSDSHRPRRLARPFAILLGLVQAVAMAVPLALGVIALESFVAPSHVAAACDGWVSSGGVAASGHDFVDFTSGAGSWSTGHLRVKLPTSYTCSAWSRTYTYDALSTTSNGHWYWMRMMTVAGGTTNCNYVGSGADYMRTDGCGNGDYNVISGAGISQNTTYANFGIGYASCSTDYGAHVGWTSSASPGANCGTPATREPDGSPPKFDWTAPSAPSITITPGSHAVFVSVGRIYVDGNVASSITSTASGSTDSGGSGLSGYSQVLSANTGGFSPLTSTSASQVFSWTAGLYDDQSLELTVTAKDVAGNTSTATNDFIWADSAPPIAAITSPSANGVVGGTVAVTGSAWDVTAFQDYTLDYGVGLSPTTWTPIGTYTTPVTNGVLANWPTLGLNGVYTLRLTARDYLVAVSPATHQTVVTAPIYIENGRRGDESFLTRVPFDINGGYQLNVGVANGEATLDRSLFSIPSYGPPQELDLSYSSLESTTSGLFGYGWVSNLSQYLTFDSGFVVWHSSDGGRIPFGSQGGIWVPILGHFEKLAHGSGTYTITLKDQSTLTFSDTAPGRLSKITNRFGKSLTIIWNATSAIATDASNRPTTLTIDSANNRVTDVMDSAGRHWGFGYDGSGNLTSITDPLAHGTTLGYDATHELTTVARVRTAADGTHPTLTWTVGYTAGKATTVADPIGGSSVTDNFTYNSGNTVVGLLKTYIPVTRNSSTYTYDGSGRVTALLDPQGNTTSYHYDLDQLNGPSLLTSLLRPLDSTHWSTTSYTYDAAGNVLTETDPLFNSVYVTSVMSYDTGNDLITKSVGDSDSNVKVVTLNSYDGAGHRTSTIENCTSIGTTLPSPASSCTGAGTHDSTWNLTTTFVYTSNDQVDVAWDPLGIATKHSYDVYGNETSLVADCTSSGSTLPTRGTTCSAAGNHDSATNVTTGHAFSSANNGGKIGLPSSMTDPVSAVTMYDYDVLGNITSHVSPGDASLPVLTTTSSYDEFGERLVSTDSWPGISGGNRVTTDVYDLRGHLTSETMTPSGIAVTHAFDAAGDETQTVAQGVTTNRSGFDSLGNATTEVTAPGTSVESDTTYTFDPQGHELTSTMNGATTTYTYDYAGRVSTERDNTSGITVSHWYDSLGRENRTDTSGSGSTFASFDRDGRSIQTQDAAALKTDTTLDADGRLISRSHPYSGASPTALDTTTFDALGRATSMVVNYVSGGSGPDQNLTTSAAYDAAGREIASMDPTGVVSVTIVNVGGEPAKVVGNCVDAPPPSSWWQCSGSGTKTSTQNLTTTTTYDGTGAVLLSVQVHVSPPNSTTTSVFDAAGRLQAVQDPRGTVTRTLYDTSGNLTKSVVNCVDTSPPPNWWDCTGSAAQDGTQNLTTLDTFDAAGHRASETAPNGRLTTYSYDQASELIKVVDNDVATPTQPDQDVTTDYHYDTLGRQDAIRDAVGRVTINHYDPTTGFLTWVLTRCVDTAPPVNWWQCSGTASPDYQTNIKTSYGYDLSGRKVSAVAPAPNAVHSDVASFVTTEYAYDTNGRLCRVLEAAGIGVVLQSLADPCSTAVTGSTLSNVSTRYLYDANGNMTSMIDADGHTTSYGFDRDGNMTSVTDADGHTESWTFDGQGHQLTQANRGAGGVTWTYDEAGRVSSRAADGTTVTYGYDLNGNRTSVAMGSETIATTYDPLNRPLNVTDSVDSGTTTTYTYGLLSGTRLDPSTGTAYQFSLDKFGREIGMVDPIHGAGAPWTTTYTADGQVSNLIAPNGNTTASTYDSVGRLTTSTTTAAGPVTRAAYVYSYNAAGQRLSEASTVTGDTANGTAVFGYDPLGQIASYSGVPGVSSGAYSFDKVPNRLTKQVGGGGNVTTTFDAANRPTVDSAGGVYVADLDGRVTTRPYLGGSETLAYDSLGRLTSVIAGGTTTTYGYDPLDRLVSVARGGTLSKLRYVGTTTTLAQVRDASNVVQYGLATSTAGVPRFDFSGGGISQRFYGQDGHQDVTWLADGTGAVIASERFDPWGSPTVTHGTFPDLRFQGSWYDTSTGLAWAVNRWYSPDLGTFTTEDSVVGATNDPSSRQLYAYGAGDPIGRLDQQGTFWYSVQPGDTLYSISSGYFGSTSYWRWIWNLNRHRIKNWNYIQTGWCLWIPVSTHRRILRDQCQEQRPITDITSDDDSPYASLAQTKLAASTLGVDLRTLTYPRLITLTRNSTGRVADPGMFLTWWYQVNVNSIKLLASQIGKQWPLDFSLGGHVVSHEGGVTWLNQNARLPSMFSGADAVTIGDRIFLRGSGSTAPNDPLAAHEYIHVLQGENGGVTLWYQYFLEALQHRGMPSNHIEALPYIWQGYIATYGVANTALGPDYGDNQPWCTFRPLVPTWDYCPAH